MAAFLAGHITVKNEALWQQYVAGVAESIEPFESTIIFRGKLNSVLSGEHSHDIGSYQGHRKG